MNENKVSMKFIVAIHTLDIGRYNMAMYMSTRVTSVCEWAHS